MSITLSLSTPMACSCSPLCDYTACISITLVLCLNDNRHNTYLLMSLPLMLFVLAITLTHVISTCAIVILHNATS